MNSNIPGTKARRRGTAFSLRYMQISGSQNAEGRPVHCPSKLCTSLPTLNLISNPFLSPLKYSTNFDPRDVLLLREEGGDGGNREIHATPFEGKPSFSQHEGGMAGAAGFASESYWREEWGVGARSGGLAGSERSLGWREEWGPERSLGTD